jgi:hypothetical protein
MGNKAATLRHRQAAEEIVEECYRLVNEKKGSRNRGFKESSK